MADFENPYASPETKIVPEAVQNSGVQFTVNMLKYLNEASPWLRFVGVLGYIGASLAVLSGLIASLGAIAAGSYFGGFSGIFGLVFLFYIPMGVVLFFPAHFTYKFGQKIRNYKFTNSITDLEEALKNNKSFWKFTGILCIVYLAIIPVFIIGAIIVGIVSTFTYFNF